MGELSVDKQSDNQGEDSQFCRLNEDTETCKENGLKIHEMKLGRFTVKPEQASTSDVSQLHMGERDKEESLLLRRHRVDLRTPKHARFISFSKKELQRCLDFVEFRASDSLLLYGLENPCSISANPKSSKMKLLFDQSEPRKNSRSNNLGSFIVPCPIVAGSSIVVSDTAGQWIVGAIDEKINLNDILVSRLIRHFGSPDNNMKFGRLGSSDVIETNCSMSPSNSPGFGSPQLKIEKSPTGNRRHGSKPLGQRLISSSSYTKSAGSNQLSSPASATVFQGMLHCTWKSGIPHFVFSCDDHNEVFVADLLKVESSDYKDLDFMYMFHTRKSVSKMHRSYNNAPNLIGKMKVSKSSFLCSNNSKLAETEFVLVGTKEDHLVDVQNSDSTMRKHKGSPKNVVEMFRPNPLFKHKATPKFGVTGSTLHDSFSDPCENMCNKPEALDSGNLLECPKEFELAAIVVKDHLREHCRGATTGGWGLKFLEKARVEPADAYLEASVSSGFGHASLWNQSDCSTSMNVIVPAGMHSGPRIKHGGPSSLTKRWRSGGKCDCGGWDVGCPLTVLCSRLGEYEEFTNVDMQDECRSYDLFKEGSNKDFPIWRMAKIQDELYVIHFQSMLSSLQAFSIGVASVHSQNKFALCSKNLKKLKQQKPG
ncbi:hypothetical protein MKW94_010212 [Papaver nudicaule]|uniref:Uncharacterized protein n=1 Tax=Papaver nudicaule TaxID=74823 RepID=A0AA41UXI6_PAPNU|nr:hypothetical protein [Papaver nudicaule]